MITATSYSIRDLMWIGRRYTGWRYRRPDLADVREIVLAAQASGEDVPSSLWIECECQEGCDEPATGTDDSGNAVCDTCVDYICDDDGTIVCPCCDRCETCGEHRLSSSGPGDRPDMAYVRVRCRCERGEDTIDPQGRYATIDSQDGSVWQRYSTAEAAIAASEYWYESVRRQPGSTHYLYHLMHCPEAAGLDDDGRWCRLQDDGG